MSVPVDPAVLRAHPCIDDARLDPDGRTLRISPAPAATAVVPEPGALVREFLESWSEVYDWTYGKAEHRHAADLDLSGWRASDTGRPLPAEHMREWADHTVALILAAEPSYVLEPGCGTGLLAHRLRGRVSGYVGTDVAETAVRRLADGAAPGTAFVRAAADALASGPVRAAMTEAGFPDGRPDCVVLNSITQCFPGVAYLDAVLRAAIGLVSPGGTVLVGDVRDARLLPAFARWIERSAAPGPGIDARAAERAARDAEFLFDPPLLARRAAAIGASLGRDVRMSVHPKTMRADTELTRYRFDAVLYVDTPEPPTPENIAWTDLPTDQAAVPATSPPADRPDDAPDDQAAARTTHLPHDPPATRATDQPTSPSTGPPDDRAVGLAVDRGAVLASLLGSGPVRVCGIPLAPLSDVPGAVTAARLRAIAPDAAVVADPRDPARAEVVRPAGAAAVPVARIAGAPGTVHDPFAAFVERRLTEIARLTLRRAGHPGDVAVTVEPGLPQRAARAYEAAATPDPAPLLTFLRRLDETALDAMCAALRTAEIARRDRGFDAAALADALGVADRHRWLLRRWLDALVRHDRLLRLDGDRYTGLRQGARRRLGAARAGLADEGEAVGYPAATTDFLLNAMARLPEILRDELPVQSLLFDDTATADGAYRENPVNRPLNAGVAEVLRWAEAGAPPRVLELGAGVGGTTAAALDALRGPVNYLFTDVSRYFLSLGRARFGDRPGTRFAPYDVNDPAEQGVPPGSMDVVLSANVLHNARHTGDMLARLARLLAPGGLLVFVETGRELPSILASMQFLMSGPPGELRLDPRDPRAARDRVFLTPDEWNDGLRAAGLEPWFTLPDAHHPLAAAGLHLFVARRPR
ncbi:methyltransferase [Actinomadura flavalba]|uniref:methyltransferase n=1 Tax=Actinomadura flavalba TaxID=1120938 RepID=UPI0003625788|nr:methyltransferase [Actinomadura flavalba]